MTLAELLAGLDGVRATGPLDVEILSVVHDSRAAGPGSLFVALPGARTDGNRFVREAVERGAVAVVSELEPPPPPFCAPRRVGSGEPARWVRVPDVLAAYSLAAARFHANPSARLSVIGVTGTNGKTTTTYFLESILEACGAPCGVIGTVGTRLRGRPLEPPSNTTPLAGDLQRLLAVMAASGATHAALEVSSHALALKRADDVHFDAAVFTNLHRDHLDFHKTREQYFQAKARLFEILTRLTNSKKRRAAVLNADDEAARRLARDIVGAEVVTYSLSSDADLTASAVVSTPEATLWRLKRRGREWAVRLKLIGEHNVSNALAAAGAAFWLGLPPERVIQGLCALERVPGRLEPVGGGQPFHVFVDYAHTDSALENVLGVLKRLPHRRLVCVFGCGGDRDRTKRGPMGVAAAKGSDLAVVTSDNPRSEDPAAIIGEVVAGIRKEGLQNYRIEPDRARAIAAAIGEAGPGDIVVIAGKGHETTQILKDRTVFFDDREAALDALRALARRRG